MSGSRDFSRRSWRLKLDRAKQHLVELDAAVARYRDGDPYRFSWKLKRRRNPHVRECVLHFDRPDPTLAIVVGDVVHNIRSGLDHLAAALVRAPQRSSSFFPIFEHDPWARNAEGAYVVLTNEVREKFERAVEGMPCGAIALLQELQPYAARCREDLWLSAVHHKASVGTSRMGRAHALQVLNRLDNADKHRGLIVIGGGAFRHLRHVRGLADRVEYDGAFTRLCVNGAVVATVVADSDADPLVKAEMEMQMDIDGPAQVVVRIAGEDGYSNVLVVLQELISITRRSVFDPLEPFIRG